MKKSRDLLNMIAQQDQFTTEMNEQIASFSEDELAELVKFARTFDLTNNLHKFAAKTIAVIVVKEGVRRRNKQESGF